MLSVRPRESTGSPFNSTGPTGIGGIGTFEYIPGLGWENEALDTEEMVLG